ncbi:hypothetical protein AB0G67_46125 [Streptomyces sp. NPDC021056]|uniref:hypothetical protein n=1 Tax=Streptomyces sp. NPDC021056 TaxID=3155012 RepID=UPI0033DFE737
MAADLDVAVDLRDEHSGVVEDGALVQGDVIVQASARSRQPSWSWPPPGLRAFGADITATGSTLRVHGPARLQGANVAAGDIRAVSALVLAALAADGTSTIQGMFHLRRGYGHLLPHLATLGAEITTTGGP